MKAFLIVFEDEIPYKIWGFGSRIVKITFFQKTKKCQREKRAKNPRKIFEKSVQKVIKKFEKISVCKNVHLMNLENVNKKNKGRRIYEKINIKKLKLVQNFYRVDDDCNACHRNLGRRQRCAKINENET